MKFHMLLTAIGCNARAASKNCCLCAKNTRFHIVFLSAIKKIEKGFKAQKRPRHSKLLYTDTTTDTFQVGL